MPQRRFRILNNANQASRVMRSNGGRRTSAPLTKIAVAPTVRGGAPPIQPYQPIARTKSKAAQRTLIIRGTAATAAETYAIGDKAGTIGTTLAPRPVNTVFSGSHGTTGENVIVENLSGFNPFHIRQLRVEVSSASVFTSSNAKVIYGDYDGSRDSQAIQFSQAKRPSNYDQTQLLFENFNITFDAMAAFVITQAAVGSPAEFFEMDFEIDMAATFYNMG